MINEEIKKANSIIANYIGFKQSEVEPDCWWCDNWGLCYLRFNEDWEWLMYAITIVQRNFPYKLQEVPYEIEIETILLSEFISNLKNNI